MKRLLLWGLMTFVSTIFVLVMAANGWAQSPGDTVGNANFYYFQTNGSTGQRIAMDSQGGLHFAWTRGYNQSGHMVYYNYRAPDGSWAWSTTGYAVNDGNQFGYPQISIYPDNRATIACHKATTNDSLILAIDNFDGMGEFDLHHTPASSGNAQFLWPYLTVDHGNRIHVIATQSNVNPGQAMVIGYTRSANEGQTWTNIQAVDTATTISTIVVSSPISNKVAIVYTHPVNPLSQKMNDVFYIQSTDGTTWDFEGGKVNLTHYGQSGDSVFAFTDVDALYDSNDDLQIIWNAQWVRGDTILGDRVFLFHYDVGSGIISEISHVDVPHVSRCAFGGWNLALNKMSLGIKSSNGALYVAYTRFDTSDCSAGNTANGEIYLQYSDDGGSNWSAPEDVTNSHTPNCQAGDCASDEWPSMAKVVDDNAHIFYECVTGGGTPTYNPMLYLRYYVNPIKVNYGQSPPKTFTLSQNYPNPFNARTTISFTMNKNAAVNLAIYDILGKRITTLINQRMQTGQHHIIWNAGDMASGIYYYRLAIDGDSYSKKMVLLK